MTDHPERHQLNPEDVEGEPISDLIRRVKGLRKHVAETAARIEAEEVNLSLIKHNLLCILRELLRRGMKIEDLIKRVRGS